MTPERKKHVEMIVLFAVGMVILVLIFLYWESNKSSGTTTTTTQAPATNTVDGQPINLNFGAPTIDLSPNPYAESGYIPLFGFLGYGAYY